MMIRGQTWMEVEMVLDNDLDSLFASHSSYKVVARRHFLSTF